MCFQYIYILVSSLCFDETHELFVLAAEAIKAMSVMAKSPAASEDRLLVSENAADNLLKLAAQIALEVGLNHRV